MARPKLDDDSPRRVFPLRVQLTRQEERTLKDAADDRHVTLSRYVRELCLGRTAAAAAVTRRDPEKRELLKALTALGNNLNQIARQLNSGGDLKDPVYLADLARTIKRAIVKGLDL